MNKTLSSILEVRNKVGTVLKDGRNEFHRYNYATHNDVVHEVRHAMNDAGLVIYPCGVEHVQIDRKGAADKENFISNWTQVYRVCHVEDTDGILISIRCSGSDSTDKGAYKGNTGALKYALIQLFLLETSDDPENDKGESQPEPKPLSRREDYLPPSTDPEEPDDVPFNDDEKPFKATIEAVSKRPRKDRKEGYSYGALINGKWCNTFHKTVGEYAIKNKGKVCEIIIKPSKNPKYTDLVSVDGIMHG